MWQTIMNSSMSQQKCLLEYLYPMKIEYNKKFNEYYHYRQTYFQWNVNTKAYSLHRKYTSFPDESYYWVYNNYDTVNTTNVMFGTYYIQHKLWEHQFPQTCENKKFLIMPFWIYGMGSIIHVYTQSLQLAIDYDRILIPVLQSNGFWVDSPFCANNTFTCYFQQWTNCTINQTDYIKTYNRNVPFLSDDYAHLKSFNELKSFSNTKYVYVRLIHDFERIQSPPHLISEYLKEQPLTEIQKLAYWRYQGATFLVRLNNHTLNYINDYKNNTCKNCQQNYKLSSYIRHGDKSYEMVLSTSNHIAQLLSFLSFHMSYLNITNTISNSTYINGDDEDDMEYVSKTLKNIVYMKTPIRKNYNMFQLLEIKNIGQISFADLSESIKSHSVVGTIDSNWNRLIYELKSTIGFQSNGYILEAGEKECISVSHCQYLDRVLDFNW